MLMSCDAKNGCGSVSMTNPNLMTNGGSGFQSVQTLPYAQMTNCMAHQQEARQLVHYNTNDAPLAAGQGMNPLSRPAAGQGAAASNGQTTAGQTQGLPSDQPSLTGAAAAAIPVAASGQNAMFPSADPDIDPGMGTIPGQPDPPAAAIRGGSSVVPEGVLPEDPQIPVPANPLLPPGYQEFITYENLQYLNGFLRTQIGRYMRVEQLIGSSSIEERYGFLIAVGINYILLQELGTGNIMTMDYYSIKSLYIFYSQPTLPENPSMRF